MISRRALLLLAGLLSASCGGNPAGPAPLPPVVEPPAPPQPPPPPAPSPVLGVTRILAFGDSMTAGTTSLPATFGFTPSAGLPQSYPFKLQELLTARYATQSVVAHNAGWAGEMVSAGRARLGGVLRDAAPEVALLMEGANDLNNMRDLEGSALSSAIQRTVDAMEDMVREAQGHGVTPFVATLPPQRPDGPKGGATAFLGRYNDGLRGMAEKKGAILVDVHAGMSVEMIGQDGLHPTEAGYQRIAEVFAEALAAKYEQQP